MSSVTARYVTERGTLKKELRKCGVEELNLKNLFSIGEGKYKLFFEVFFKETGLMKMI